MEMGRFWEAVAVAVESVMLQLDREDKSLMVDVGLTADTDHMPAVADHTKVDRMMADRDVRIQVVAASIDQARSHNPS